jgi:electron transfer flavoprotein beta subunit
MKILVAVKRVVDFNARIRVKADGSGLDTATMKMTLNPFDEIAIEEAVRLKEKQRAKEILIVSIGPPSCQETLRTALAMGADRGLLVETDQTLYPLSIAKILKEVCLKELPDLVMLGKQAVDDDNNQTGQMLAGLLNWPQGTFISKLLCEEGKAKVIREIDGGLETLQLKLPAVITTDLRLNEPRYLSLPNIVQAKRKLITVQPLKDFISDTTSRLKTIEVAEPKKNRAKIRAKNVVDLVRLLRDEAQVIR